MMARASAPVDGVFLSCTNLATLDIVAPLEAALGLPVMSSEPWCLAYAAPCRARDAGPAPGAAVCKDSQRAEAALGLGVPYRPIKKQPQAFAPSAGTTSRRPGLLARDSVLSAQTPPAHRAQAPGESDMTASATVELTDLKLETSIGVYGAGDVVPRAHLRGPQIGHRSRQGADPAR